MTSPIPLVGWLSAFVYLCKGGVIGVWFVNIWISTH